MLKRNGSSGRTFPSVSFLPRNNASITSVDSEFQRDLAALHVTEPTGMLVEIGSITGSRCAPAAARVETRC